MIVILYVKNHYSDRNHIIIFYQVVLIRNLQAALDGLAVDTVAIPNTVPTSRHTVGRAADSANTTCMK